MTDDLAVRDTVKDGGELPWLAQTYKKGGNVWTDDNKWIAYRTVYRTKAWWWQFGPSWKKENWDRKIASKYCVFQRDFENCILPV